MRVFLALGLLCGGAFGCTNFLNHATDDGSTQIAYNSDGQAFYGYMNHLPALPAAAAADSSAPPAPRYREIWEFGTGIYKGRIPEANETYNVIGNMNEHR